MRRKLLPIIAMGCFFVIAQLLALALAPTFSGMGMQAFEEPGRVSNALYYLAVILIFTGVFLVFAKRGLRRLLQFFVLFAVGMTILYVLWPLLWCLIPGSDIPLLLALAIAISLVWLLYRKPEWWVIDTVGLIVAPGIVTIFGISLGILPALVLLVALAIYDAIAVYRTKHMIDLADSVVKLRLPVLLVMPRKKSYSFLREEGIKGKAKHEAMFIGLGDVIIPGILAVSALTFLQNATVAFSTLIGSLIGFVFLMILGFRRKPQAGLPLLNSGAILGYLISYWLVFGDLRFGIF